MAPPDHLQNLTVAVRVRPPGEQHVGRDRIVHVLDGQMVILTDPRDEDDILRAKRSREKRYMFDIAFDSYNTQLDVYLATTKPLIGSVIEGFNSTVFAYGPTGTGKTYTMLGTGDNPGIMALAVNEIFALIRKAKEHSFFTVTMSYLEVYNELIRDLLAPDSGDLELREDNSGLVTVAGLSEFEAQSTSEVMSILHEGNTRRTTEPTSVNKTSSRSHAVLQVTVKKQTRARSLVETESTGKLYMIDLAGSERATHTKNRGTRLVEGAHINRSLLALGNCIKALSNNSSSYVNYRDSKLTRLLKDSLGGNCRTVMIAHVSPDAAVFDETRNTLQYADRAKHIKTKVRPNLQTVSHHIAKYPIIVEELHKEIARLKKLNNDTTSLASESGVLPVKDRELLEQKRAALSRLFSKQQKIRRKLASVQSEKEACSARRAHYRHILSCVEHSKKLSPATDWDERESEVRGAEQRDSTRGRDAAISHLTEASHKLKEKYKIIEDAIEAKVCDDEHREILSLVQALHGLELDLAECQAEREGLRVLKEEQDAWMTIYREDNGVLLEIVRSQQELLNENSIQLTPEITGLYSKLRIGGLAPFSVLPRIQSGVSLSISDGEEEEEDVEIEEIEAGVSLNSSTSDTTPVFTKTYNVTEMEAVEQKAATVERDTTQTTIHVLSTPSLTDNTPKPPPPDRKLTRKGTWKVKKRSIRPRVMELDPPGADWQGGIQSTSDTLMVRGSMGDIPVPSSGSSLPLPGLSPGIQAKKAIQLQRLRALKTEPVAPKPAAKRQKKSVNQKTYNKPLAKSDHAGSTPAARAKMAEKAKIYGAPKRPRKARNTQSTSQLSIAVTGSNKKLQTHNSVRVFR